MFPRENHKLRRAREPRHPVETLEWQHYWIDGFVLNKAAPVPSDRI